MTKKDDKTAREILAKKLGPLKFGDLLMAERKSEQISSSALAKKLGISNDFLSMIEQEQALPPPDFAKMAASKLGYHPLYWRTVLQKQLQKYHLVH